MAGLIPAIHASLEKKDVDSRNKGMTNERVDVNAK